MERLPGHNRALTVPGYDRFGLGGTHRTHDQPVKSMVALVPLLAHHLERSRAARVQAQARVRRSAVGPLR